MDRRIEKIKEKKGWGFQMELCKTLLFYKTKFEETNQQMGAQIEKNCWMHLQLVDRNHNMCMMPFERVKEQIDWMKEQKLKSIKLKK